MYNNLLVIKDVTDESSWEQLQFDGSVCDQLMRLYPSYPAGARLYHEHVSDNTEVTPANEADYIALHELEGNFILVHYPQGPWAMVAVFVVSLLVAVAFKPKIPNVATRNTMASSPNNELSARVNSARPNGRIPDIFGTVRSTPDLIALPYSTFVDNIEIENSVMCIGRGSYDVQDSYDGDTPIAEIDGSSVEVYRPNVDIYAGSPYYNVGPAIAEAPLNVMRSNSVNGQTLKPANLDSYYGNNDVWFHPDGTIHVTGVESLEEQFKSGDTITLTGAYRITPPARYLLGDSVLFEPDTPTSFIVVDDLPWTDAGLIEIGTEERQAIFSDGVSSTLNLTGHVTFASVSGSGPWTVTFTDPVPAAAWAAVSPSEWIADFMDLVINYTSFVFNLDGTYTVTSVVGNVMKVTPTGAWADLPGEGSGFLSPVLAKTGDTDIGPFYLDLRDGDIVIANLVAANGLYKDDGFNQTGTSATVAISVTRVNSANVPVSDPVIHEFTLHGSSLNRNLVGLTARIAQPTPGRVAVMAYRTSLTDRTYQGQVVDEVKWRDLYHAFEMVNPDFGNVTVVRSRTSATTGALSVKERKLNLLVTREIPLRISGTTFTSELHATNNAAEIFCAVCHDPMIGNRTADDIDYDNIYDTVDEIEEYFDSTDATEFCYTIDKPEMTFEETLASVAAAVFSTAYRRGSVIRIAFEKLTPDSTLLFNHRNKLPGSETRTVRFGYENNYDGVEYKWVNPEDDAIETLTLGTAPINARKIESIGIRNANQAYWHAWRQWNKIRYQNMIVEFTATGQADLAVVSDRILVADNTRARSQDGDIVAVEGLVITTSQKLVFEPGHDYTMFLQMYDGTIEALAVSEVVGEPYQANLAGAPSLPLVTDIEAYSRTKYQMVDDDAPNRTAFLLTERESESNNTARISAINYDVRYYQNDPVDPNPPPTIYYLVTEEDDNLVTETGDFLHTGA